MSEANEEGVEPGWIELAREVAPVIDEAVDAYADRVAEHLEARATLLETSMRRVLATVGKHTEVALVISMLDQVMQREVQWLRITALEIRPDAGSA